jgi:hypothetical protein
MVSAKLHFFYCSDAAGIVQKLGRNVSGLKVGDRVFVTSTNSGSYAQYVVSDDTYVFPLHERLSFAQARVLYYLVIDSVVNPGLDFSSIRIQIKAKSLLKYNFSNLFKPKLKVNKEKKIYSNRVSNFRYSTCAFTVSVPGRYQNVLLNRSCG